MSKNKAKLSTSHQTLLKRLFSLGQRHADLNRMLGQHSLPPLPMPEFHNLRKQHQQRQMASLGLLNPPAAMPSQPAPEENQPEEENDQPQE